MCILLLSLLYAGNLLAQEEQKPAADDAAVIAKKLANPIVAIAVMILLSLIHI